MQTSSGNVHAFSSSEKSKLTPFMSRYGAFLHIYYSLLGNIAWMIQAIEKPQEFKVQCTMTTQSVFISCIISNGRYIRTYVQWSFLWSHLESIQASWPPYSILSLVNGNANTIKDFHGSIKYQYHIISLFSDPMNTVISHQQVALSWTCQLRKFLEPLQYPGTANWGNFMKPLYCLYSLLLKVQLWKEIILSNHFFPLNQFSRYFACQILCITYITLIWLQLPDWWISSHLPFCFG